MMKRLFALLLLLPALASAQWPGYVNRPASSGSSTITAGSTAISGAPCTTAGTVLFSTGSVVNCSASFLFDSSARRLSVGGVTLADGTITADGPIINGSQTWNNGVIKFTGALIVPTLTAYAAGSAALKVGAGTGAGSNAGYYSGSFNAPTGVFNFLALSSDTGNGIEFASGSGGTRKSLIYQTTDDLQINAGSSGVIKISSAASAGASLSIGGVLTSYTAGAGVYITAGTAASPVSAETITQVWNYNTAPLDGVKWTFTDTSSHANTNAFRIIGGAGGATDLFIVSKAGNITAAGLKTTGAATGKTVVCVDTGTGILYASTSGVACAN